MIKNDTGDFKITKRRKEEPPELNYFCILYKPALVPSIFKPKGIKVKDLIHQTQLFRTVFEATVNAAHIRSISMSVPLAWMDKTVTTDFYNQNLIYKLKFPRQIGKTRIIFDYIKENDVITVFSAADTKLSDNFDFDYFTRVQLGKRIIVIDGFPIEDKKRFTDAIIKQSAETGIYSPIIIVE